MSSQREVGEGEVQWYNMQHGGDSGGSQGSDVCPVRCVPSEAEDHAQGAGAQGWRVGKLQAQRGE